jgi:hypothetical protein
VSDHARIIARRLAGQRLVGKGLTSAADVVREQCAVQSQDFAGAKWAVGMRTTGLSDADVEAEFTAGKILRTHLMRPTWHFVTPEDIRWLHALTGSRVNAIMGHYDSKLGLSQKVYGRAQDLFAKALSGGKHLTREELKAVLVRAKIRVVNGEALARFVMRAEQAALITSGPRRGKQFTYALLEERAPRAPAKSRDEALGELARRYFATRSPATVHDCAWWSGLTIADVKRGIQIAGTALVRESINDREYWSSAASRPAKSVSGVRLLPNYDEYFIGYKDRSAIGHRIGSVQRVTGGNALIANVVSVNGELVGGWKRLVEGKRVVVNMDLVVPMTAAERRLVETEVVRLGRFLEAPISLQVK